MIHFYFWIAYWLSVVLVTVAVPPPYEIVRAANATSYLLLNEIAKEVPDDATALTFGFDPNKLRNVDSNELARYSANPVLPHIAYADKSPDDITRVELLKSLAVMGDQLKDVHYVGEYMNPAVVKWRGRLLLVTGSNYGRANSKTTKNALLEFRWLNDSILPFTDNAQFLGISSGEVEVLGKEAFGEDPRVLVLSEDRFMVFYAYPFQALTRIGMLEVSVNPETQRAEIATLHSSIHPTVDFSMRHKNWAPFEAQNGDVLLVQNINPLVVVKPVLHASDGAMHAEVVSSASKLELWWPYGALRGGTNALYLPAQNAYLAFFHSKCSFPGNYMFTYVAGAYTFSAQAPYKLLSVSALPVMSERFYTGPWSPLRTARIDYCFFPTAIHLEGVHIVMSAGFQDHSGFIMRLELRTVLDTLVPV